MVSLGTHPETSLTAPPLTPPMIFYCGWQWNPRVRVGRSLVPGLQPVAVDLKMLLYAIGAIQLQINVLSCLVSV